MVVCHCEVVSDRAIRAAIAAGACDVDDVTTGSGAGGRCGGCVPSIERLLADAGLAFSSPDSLTARQASRRIARAADVELRA